MEAAYAFIGKRDIFRLKILCRPNFLLDNQQLPQINKILPVTPSLAWTAISFACLAWTAISFAQK
jgi:hypothetical protein